MRYRTYKNMVKATQMIADKGYDWDEANRDENIRNGVYR